MFYYQNSTLGPNLLVASTEDEEYKHRSRKRLLRDVGNEHTQRSKNGLMDNKRTCLGKEEMEKQNQSELHDELKNLYANKKANVIMQFQSDEDDNENESKEQNQPHVKLGTKQSTKSQQNSQNIEEQYFQIPKKNNFLLDFSDQQNSIQGVNPQQNIIKQEQISYQKTNSNKNNLILNFDSQSQQQVPQIGPTQRLNSCRSPKDVFALILSAAKQQYWLQPVPEQLVLQCIIKRQRSTSTTKYHIYDSSTLHNILSVIKSDEGYLFLSKYENLTNSRTPTRKETVVAKLQSNFFGTEFNCFLWTYPCKKFTNFTLDPDKSSQIITIQYETNIFGLKGPRKMSAFIPSNQPLISKKRLNELYEHQKKKKLPQTVYKFKNKTPKWNTNIEAYVLNFFGRATVSSIKNFIMVSQNQGEDAEPRVLFGKFGKDLFNLDIRYPFNIVQGVAMALSSFDKKLACQ